MISRLAHLSVATFISLAICISPISVMAADPVPATAPAASPAASSEEKVVEKKVKKEKKAEKKVKKKSKKKAKVVTQ